MIRSHRIGEESTFLGQTCALCKQSFANGDEIVICPEDGSRHHVRCWEANGDRCTAYGCQGRGEVGEAVSLPRRPRPVGRPPATAAARARRQPPGVASRIAPDSKVRVLPAGSVSCAQGCILVAIALAIVLAAFGCFGLWAIADYLMIEVFDLPYRGPISGFDLQRLANALTLSIV